MAFKFKLNQLLQIALHEENEVKNALARKDGEIAKLNEQIKEFQEKQAQACADQQKAMLSGDLITARMYPAYLKSLKKSEDFYANEMQLQQKEREKIMTAYLEKQRKRKIFEKMREADEAKWKKEMLKKEQVRLDEFSSRKKTSLMETDDA